mgnify:CR=1 FL=1
MFKSLIDSITLLEIAFAKEFESAILKKQGYRCYGQIMNVYVHMKWVLLKLDELKDAKTNKVAPYFDISFQHAHPDVLVELLVFSHLAILLEENLFPPTPLFDLQPMSRRYSQDVPNSLNL